MKKFIIVILFFSHCFNVHAMKKQRPNFYDYDTSIIEPALEHRQSCPPLTILDLVNETLRTLKSQYPSYSVSGIRQGAKSKETLMHPQAQPTDHLIIFTLTHNFSKKPNFEKILDIKKNSLSTWDGKKTVDDLVIL